MNFISICKVNILKYSVILPDDFFQVWTQVRSLMEKNATLEATKRSLEDEMERVREIWQLILKQIHLFDFAGHVSLVA